MCRKVGFYFSNYPHICTLPRGLLGVCSLDDVHYLIHRRRESHWTCILDFLLVSWHIWGASHFFIGRAPRNPICLILILHSLCCILTLGFSPAVWSSPGCSKLISWAAGTRGAVRLWHIHIFCVSYQFATWDVEDSLHGRGWSSSCWKGLRLQAKPSHSLMRCTCPQIFSSHSLPLFSRTVGLNGFLTTLCVNQKKEQQVTKQDL